MPTEIPQELLEEMILMDDKKFEYFEKKWYANEQAKEEYSRQYYNQLQGYIDYNKTFGEKVCPIKPLDNAILLDTQLLAEARAHNIEMKIAAQKQQRDGLRKDFTDTQTMTDRIFDGLLLGKLMEQAAEEPSAPDHDERQQEIEKDIEPDIDL